ncbi:MAG TPA: amidohydrolase family protein, partial [Gemmatimonadaceae bacterium]|nr:amidohydrolase family protein [Gemmatimonadaceae bacterium]
MSLTVDVHAHVIPESIMGKAGPHGPEFELTESGSWRMRRGTETSMLHAIAHTAYAAGRGGDDPSQWGDRLSNPHRRLKEMDELGVDAMVVSPSPPLYMYDIEPEYSIPYTKAYNDALAEYCRADPTRLYFVATLPLRDLEEAPLEARRAISDLGARGVYIGASNLGGRELDDPAFFPLYEELIAADLPLGIHPGGLGKGRDFLGLPSRFREGAALGFPAQETHAIFLLIAGGVFDRFPELKVTVSHGGGFFPYQFTRIEEFLKLEGDKRNPKNHVGDYFNNLYFDFVLHDARARKLLLDVAGTDHVMLGSNYAGMDSVDGGALVDSLNLSDVDANRIKGENAEQL